MKLLFNKETLEGHYFCDEEDTSGYTEKIPPDTSYVWDEEINEWTQPPEPEPEPEEEI